MALTVDTPVQYVKGVGPKLGEVLKKKGIETIHDLLQFYPRAYEDRRAARNIASLQANDYVGLRAEIIKVSAIPLGRTGRKIYDVTIGDASGRIHCKFFRTPYRGYFEKLKPKTQVRVLGRVILYRNQLEFHHPELSEWNDTDTVANSTEKDELLPIYSETEGLTSKKIQTIVGCAFEALSWPPKFLDEGDRIPAWIRKKNNLAPYVMSLHRLHFPEAGQGQAYLDRKTPYHYRIIFEEFFMLEMILASRKKGMQSFQAPSLGAHQKLEKDFISQLPFELTSAQLRVIDEIKKDIALSRPMNRLVQGDVGSGKTLVALVAALHAMAEGYQVALMAPTEILAQQHLNNATKFLKNTPFKTELLSGQLKGKEKKLVLEKLKNSEANLIVGTHALIQEGVEFANLGLVIVDEQHRFGVEQRSILRKKGRSPHFLLMTATPIPRSLAMTIYGDLDVSAINEMPKGRQPIVTRATFQTKRAQVLGFVQDHLVKGRQAYVIFPLVEESEKIDLKSAITEFEKLQIELPKFRVGLLHGRMKGEEKEDVMERFRKHELDMLVSTTVIEVGVDVPNATIMWIEHAERFGLSQLHQLRGRVGRGEHKSFCILMMGWAQSPEAQERVRFMESTNDGFKIAEYDLEIRGPGEFLGVRQSGMPGFKMANLVRDLPILEQARTAAFELLEKDPKLSTRDSQLLKEQMKQSDAALS